MQPSESQLEFDVAHNELLLTAPGFRSVLSSIEGLTGQALTFVLASGGSAMLQAVSLIAGTHGPELALLNSDTYAPEFVLEKLP